MFPRNKFVRSKLIRLIVSFYSHADTVSDPEISPHKQNKKCVFGA